MASFFFFFCWEKKGEAVRENSSRRPVKSALRKRLTILAQRPVAPCIVARNYRPPIAKSVPN